MQNRIASPKRKRGSYIARMFGHYRRQASKRGFKWKLTRQQFARITALNCAYCGAKPKTRFFHRHKARTESKERVNGIDRVNSAKGYTLRNSAPACKLCNRMKSALSLREFMRHIAKIVERAK